MPPAVSHPRLRPVEMVFVQDPERGRVLRLRDTEGIAPGAVDLPPHLAGVVARFDGRSTPAQIAAAAGKASAQTISPALVEQVAAELDAALMLDTPAFHARRRDVVRAFAAAAVRPASHAGGAYHADPTRLTRYIEDACFAGVPARPRGGTLIGLTAPHMDFWRAAAGYGHAYRALAEGIDPHADTFVLLGTSHAPMGRPFAVCAKAFATPLGRLEPDHDALRDLADGSRFDVREDEYLHKNEHSLELQAVFLRHVLGARAATARIVPILCGLGDAQGRRRDPASDPDAESFLVALRRLVEARAGRIVLIAGADLAHVGPRFGDPGPLDAPGRERLAARDEESIALALARDARGFFRQVVSDLTTRRVCGLGPIYTLLRALPGGRGERLSYAQHVDPDEGSIVSHASLSFVA